MLSVFFTPGLIDLTDAVEVGELVNTMLLPGFARELAGT